MKRSKAKKRHPRQPVHKVDGVLRFKGNPFVRVLLETSSFNLNNFYEMVQSPDLKFTEDDLSQLCQLLGYSVSGYGDLVIMRSGKAAELYEKHAQDAYAEYEAGRRGNSK